HTRSKRDWSSDVCSSDLSEEWKQLDAGLISRYRANQQMLERARKEGCEFEVKTVIEDWTTMLTTRQKTAEILALLKASGYRLYRSEERRVGKEIRTRCTR